MSLAGLNQWRGKQPKGDRWRPRKASGPTEATGPVPWSSRDRRRAVCTSFQNHPKIAQIATARGCLTVLDARRLPKTNGCPNLTVGLTLGEQSRIAKLQKEYSEGHDRNSF